MSGGIKRFSKWMSHYEEEGFRLQQYMPDACNLDHHVFGNRWRNALLRVALKWTETTPRPLERPMTVEEFFARSTSGNGNSRKFA